MVAVVRPEDAARALKHLSWLGQKAWAIGELVRGPKGVVLIK
jgi:hydrogenase maturation factor